MTNNINTSVKPFLTVNNGRKAVAFYVAAFGAMEIKRFDLPDQKISSVLEIETSGFYVGDEEPHHGNFSPGAHPGSPVRIILQTKNADEIFIRALSLGATEICPMTTEDDWRIGKLKDPFGHIWEIGFPVLNQA